MAFKVLKFQDKIILSISKTAKTFWRLETKIFVFMTIKTTKYFIRFTD